MFKFCCTLFAVALSYAPVQSKPLTLLALGDSLTAGLGLESALAFPSRLETALKAKGYDVIVLNAGVSGDTAADGAARLDWALADDVNGVIVELGANDALRGLPPAQAKQALADIIERVKQKERGVLLLGMRAPPNLGKDYAAAFDAMYPELARQFAVPLYPFYLDGVAANAALNQPDGMHPNAKGVDEIVQRLLPTVETWLSHLK